MTAENYLSDLIEELNCSEDKRQQVMGYILLQLDEIKKQGASSQKELCMQIQLYCHIQQRLNKLLQETHDLSKKVESTLGQEYNYLREENYENMKKELDRQPMVFVTGSSNAGKSSLINEIIRNPNDPRESIVLPEAEIPCTARITKVIYGNKPEIRIINENGDIQHHFLMIGEERTQVEKLITDRNLGDKLTVEVLNPHPLFESGLLLIDAPGTGEGKEITKPVLDFIKQNKLMAILYVCDGKKSLQQTYLNDIKFIKQHGEYKTMIYVFNKIEQTENVDDDEMEYIENIEQECDPDCPFMFCGTHSPPDKLVEKCTNILHKHALIDPTDQIVGVSARLSCHLRNGRIKHNHIKTLSSNYFYMENIIAESFKSNARGLIENVALELFRIQEITFKALMSLDGHIRYAHNLTFALLEKYESFEKQLYEELQEVITNFPALQILEEFKKSELIPKIEGFQDQNMAINMTAINVFDEAFRRTDKMILTKCAVLVESLKNFCDTIALLCSRHFYFKFSQDVGNGALIRAQKLFELLRQLNSINNSNLVIHMNSQCKHTISKADRAISIMQLALANMLGVVGKKVKSYFPESIINQFQNFVKNNVHTIERAVVNEKSFHIIANKFLEVLDFHAICDTIHKDAHHALTIGHGSNLQLIDKLRKTININNPINEEIAKIIDSDLKSRFGSIMIETVDVEFEVFNESNVDLRLITLNDLEVLKTGREAIIYRTSIKGLENMAVRFVRRDTLSETRWTTICLDLINSFTIKWSATSKILSQKNDLENECSQEERDYHSLLPVKFWSHRTESHEHLLIFTELAECSLLEYLFSNNVSYMRKLQLAHDILFGLRCHHAQGYTNDDLRPESILICTNGHAKINLSKSADTFKPIKLANGEEVTAFHIHPEMYATYPSVTLYYDLYAFGILIWMIFEGSGSRRPSNFSKVNSNEEQLDLLKMNIFPDELHGIPEVIAELLKNIWLCVSVDGLNGYHSLMKKADSVLTLCLRQFENNV